MQMSVVVFYIIDQSAGMIIKQCVSAFVYFL